MIRQTLLVAMLFVAGEAMAQTTPPTAPVQPPVAAPATPPAAAPETGRRAISPEMRERFRADMRVCRDEVRGKDLPRGERRMAFRTCMEARNGDYRPFFARAETRRAEMRQLRRECRAENDGKRLTRDERRTAMRGCMEAKKPELKKAFACMDEARTKGLNPGPERRAFMRTCLTAG
ncbi:MAG: PsiF family protein [Beijerinckiaceae bacterium]